MNHLTATEFVDALDGTLDERRMRHLDTCPMCRTQIDNLRSALVSGLAVEQPEPSPLFWANFSERVNTSIGGTRVEGSRWLSGILSPGVLGAAALIVVVVIGAFWRSEIAEPRTDESMIVTRDLLLEPDESEAEKAWAAVRAAAEGIAWDEVHDAGLSTRPGQAERAVNSLTDKERERLIALLEEDLKKAGD
jgi:hypothetical protein